MESSICDPVARDLAAREARIRRQAGLLHQLARGTAACRGMPSQTCGRKVPRLPSRLEDQPVLARHDLREQVGLVGEAQRLGRREQRHLDAALRPFLARSAPGSAGRGTPRRARSARRPRRAARAAARLPMQPRSAPSLVSVTKVAPACAARERRSRRRSSAEDLLSMAPRAIESSVAPGLVERRLAALVQPRTTSSRPRGPCRRRYRPSCRPPAASPADSRFVATASKPFSGVAPQASSWSRSVAKRRDARERRAVDRARLLVRVVVRQVGRDHDQRLRPAPQPLDAPAATCSDARAADGERHQREIAQHLLQERQLHLERMLERVRRVARHDLRQVAQRARALRGRCGSGRAAWRTPRRSAPRGRAPPRGAPGRAAPRGARMPRAAASSS